LNEKELVHENNVEIYSYGVYTQDGNILINILDLDLNTYTLTFDKENNLYFRDAYQRFIVLDERN